MGVVPHITLSWTNRSNSTDIIYIPDVNNNMYHEINNIKK